MLNFQFRTNFHLKLNKIHHHHLKTFSRFMRCITNDISLHLSQHNHNITQTTECFQGGRCSTLCVLPPIRSIDLVVLKMCYDYDKEPPSITKAF